MAYTTIDDPTIYFNTLLYTGNGSQRNITGVGFQPDWIWGKNRSATGSHNLVDSVRGVSKVLYANLTDAEATDATSFNAFGSDGFSVGSQSNVNGNGNSIVAWNWKAGGSASSNSNGSITSSVSANTTAGFSIVSYSGNSTAGATVGHGLGVVPSVVLVKSRDGAYGWGMYHHKNTSAPETEYLSINNTDATVDDVNFWNDTAPTSSVFSLGGTDAINKTSNSHVAYCFAEKKGFSKFGSYTGNGNTDGTFIYCGFQPAWVMIKRTDGTNSWVIYDNKREGYNVDNDALQANGNNAEGTSDDLDILSNGFKMRTSGVGENGSGNSYIFMCFAKNPFTTSTGIPTTAR